MKHVALVFCKEAIWGVLSPISFLTEANLQRAISLLENEACDLAYVALDHLDEGKKEAAEKYLSKCVGNLSQKMQAKIFISASTRPYVEALTEYIRHIPGEVSISILARVDEKRYIENAINAVIDVQPIGVGGEKKLPLVFIRGVRATYKPKNALQ